MTIHARVSATDQLVEFIDFHPSGRFHPSIRWVEVPEALDNWVDELWVYKDGVIQPADLDQFKRRLYARLATRRWEEMVKLVTTEIAGEPVRFGYDRDSDSLQKKLSVAQVIEAQRNETGEPEPYSFTFSAIDGPVTMTKSDIVTAGLALEARVQACFDREAEIRADLESRRTPHTLVEAWNAQIDEGWPAA